MQIHHFMMSCAILFTSDLAYHVTGYSAAINIDKK